MRKLKIMNKCLLCIASESVNNSESFGGTFQNIPKEKLRIETSGEQARKIAGSSSDIHSIYVISCDDLDSINLAAAIKHDNPEKKVNLIVDRDSGSLKSRTQACGIDRILTHQNFAEALKKDIDAEILQCKGADSLQVLPNNEADVQALSASGCVYDQEPTGSQYDLRVDSQVCQNAEYKTSCWVMSVFSGSGGAGKSTVSAISAQLFASMGYKTLLVDCDLQFGDLKEAFKKVNFASIDRIAEAPEKMSSLCDESKDSLLVLQAPRCLESSEVVAPKITELLLCASQTFDVIVVNTGSCWSDVHANLMKISSLSLFLIDQRVSSVRGCRHALELAERLNISSQSFKFALNRCCKKSALCASDIQPTLGGCEVFELAEGSLEVEEKMCLGLVIDLVRHRNPLSMSVFEMLKSTCPLSVGQSRRATNKRVFAR